MDRASQPLLSGKFEAYKNYNGSQDACPTTPNFVKLKYLCVVVFSRPIKLRSGWQPF